MKIKSLMWMSLMFSIIMTMSNSPMIMWMMMEISNMMFIMMLTLMQSKNNNVPALMMLVQFFSSSLMLMGIIESSTMLISMGILTKLGMFPAHMWMPMVIFLSPWKLNMLLMTLPKIPPFMIMNIMSNNNYVFLSTILTPLISLIKLIKTSDMKVIMALSSMIHSSWMILAKSISFSCWQFYFTMYTLNTIMMCKFLMMSKYNNNINNMNLLTKVIMVLMLFSMMGMPPVTMFMTKIYTVNMMSMMMITILIVLLVASAISMVYYSRMFLKTFFGSTKKSKIKINLKSISLYDIIWIIFIIMLIVMM
uniref:NADH-ubiquinone oxidoreductase chain 2 n=1 Tax=Wallacidia oculata TaxID=590134 RepID=E0WBN3_9HYME|nr:NADH dehydrogenase subunit 2 [Wallacidia oculata]